MARARCQETKFLFHHRRRRLSDFQAISGSGGAARALLTQGRYCFWTGNTEQAIPLIKRAIRRQPDLSEAYCALGLAYEELGRLLEALACFQAGLIFRPDYAPAQYNLGIVFSKLGHHQEAEEACRSAVQMAPEDFMAHSALGAIHFTSGDYEKAAESFRQVLRIKPDYGNGHLDLGLTYLKLGDWRSARKEHAALERLDLALADLLQGLIEEETDHGTVNPEVAGWGSGTP